MRRSSSVFILLSFVLLGSSVHASAQQHAWAWGANRFGQLGDGTNTNRWTPVQVVGLTGVVAVAAGLEHSLAVRSDGTVWAWGYNKFGQLGDGTDITRVTPVPVLVPVHVITVAAGLNHSVALGSDGTVWAWGSNQEGQLGDGTNANQPTPVPVVGLDRVVAVAAGGNHCLALRSDGTVWAWGLNSYGQLGDGTTTTRRTPVQVVGLTDAVAVAAGLYHSLALRSDGTVWAWGYNWYGQLGDGTTVTRLTPVPVVDLSNVIAVATRHAHSIALRSDGTIWAWGENWNGQLGDGTNTNRRSPTQVVGLTDVVAVAAGASHSLAMQSDGTLWAWGANAAGQLGDGTHTERWTPVQVLGLADAWALAAGRGYTLAAALPRPTPTDTRAIDRVGTISDSLTLRGYLKRVWDSAPIPGRLIRFSVDGTNVGSAETDSSGQAAFDWVIIDGPNTRTIEASFDGDAVYAASSGTASLTTQSWTTKMATFDRTARISALTELKCRLVRSDNVPVVNKSINFYVDGTFVASASTDVNGYARHQYLVPDGTGAGVRTILSEWVGNAGYAAVSKTATMTVLKARAHIWVRPATALVGDVARLYAHFRRLPDLQPQQGKTVSFTVDGTWIADVTTGGDEPGIARYNYVTTGLTAGTYTIRCEYPGDPWVDAGYGEATLTVAKATPHIWVLSRTVSQGQQARLYALFRRLPDLQRQEGKTLSFSIDGTWIGDAVTGGLEPGVARYNYPTSGLGVGTYTIRCDFAGDGFVTPGFGEATLTIVP